MTKLVHFFLILVVLIFVVPVLALHASFEVVRSTSLYDLKNGSRYDGMDYIVGASIKTQYGNFSTKMSYSQDLNETSGENSTINDANISYRPPGFELDQKFLDFLIRWNSNVSMIVPLSKKSTTTDQLQTGIFVSTGLDFSTAPAKNIKDSPSAWSFGISASLGQNFHQYDTGTGGGILNKNSFSQSAYLGYEISDFAFSGSISNCFRYPYRGEVRQSFVASESVNYKISSMWSVSLTHSNSGNVFKPNGSDSNVAFVDEDNSILSLGTAFQF